MRRRAIVFSPEARDDILQIYDWIEERAGSDVALAYIGRLETYCRASERGRRRDDLRPGLRAVGFERRVTIAFFVEEERVTILRLFYGGKDWEAALA
ncbi:type II toxin-antitoxin system RelE/ParE family toxin [Methylosinus sp. LW4]|uniref:type II toxin-antitoxin system RelE/ParE family toxin n=1 Tax=Methylosinus sp. LW4 TaxID=136993 RepID=UPI00035C747C|nr:type II toxin-antitoxin system RelE/ParE family toxin [Methylosinus sp. LW4]